MRVPIFSGKGVYLIWRCSLGKVSIESPGKGVIFVIANANQYPRQGVDLFPRY